MNREKAGGLSIRVAHHPGAIAEAAEKVGSFYCQHGCSRETGFRLQLAVAETLNNLYQHGTRPAEGGVHDWLFVRARSLPDMASILVCMKTDSGRTELPAATLPEWSAEQGRGLYILQNWLDTFQQRRYRGLILWRLAIRH